MALTFGIALDFGSKLRPLREHLERQAGVLRLSEEVGLRLVAAGETSSPGAFHLPDALQVLSAVSLQTETETDVRLCTGIALLPAWQPWRLALDAAQLDQLSGGRMVLGVGLGTAALRAQAGWSSESVGATADEYLQALRALWSGAAEYHGAHINVRAALPILPVQPGGPPIWVGGTIRRSAVRAARYGDGWYAGINFRLSRLPTNVGWYRAALGAAGKSPDSGSVIINRLTLTAETPEQVTELTQRYLASSLRTYAGDTSLEQTIDDVALIGTPEQISAQARRYAAEGVTHIFARLSLDDMPLEVVTQTVRLLGREVLPSL